MSTYNDSIISQDARQELTPPTRTISRDTEAYIVTILSPRCFLVETEDGAYLGQCSSWQAVLRLIGVVESTDEPHV